MDNTLDKAPGDGTGEAPDVKLSASKKNVSKTKNDHQSSDSVDWTQMLPPQQVRSQLYRQEPKLPRIPINNAQHIGTTAALFLKDLVERSSVYAAKQEKTQGHSGALVKCAHVYQVVQDNENFGFVKDALEENGIMKRMQKEQIGAVEYKPRAKRPRTATTTSQNAQKVMKSVGQPQEEVTDTGVVARQSTDQIIVDDDDYD
jgi:hypothetical protein